MKYEIKNAENAVLKTLVILIFYLVILFFNMYSYLYFSDNKILVFDKIINLLNYPIFKDYNFIDKLLYIFINAYYILYFVVFYIYEYICVHNNIATRYNSKKWIIHKYVVGIISIIIISIIQYGCIYYVFGNAMPNNLKYYLYPIIVRVLIMNYVYTFYNVFKTNKFVFLIALPPFIYILIDFNFDMYILIIVILFIINYLFFNLRLFRYSFCRKNKRRKRYLVK